MVATVKIIPFAVPRRAVETVMALLREGTAAEVHPWRPLRAALVSTTLPTLKSSVIDKTERITCARLAAVGGSVSAHTKVRHEAAAVVAELTRIEGADLVVVFGASAMADEDDVIPSAIRAAGGTVEAVGMPVDPGNLLCLGTRNGVPVIGAPGCARSPAENGFDWLLRRIAAGLPVGNGWVRSLGVGGLLMEIESRPSLREPLPTVVLAAGCSSRMGETNKLTRELAGKPLVAHAVDAVLAANNGPVLVVTGHEAELVEGALAGRDVRFVRNLAFAEGMSTSLKAGLDAIGEAAGVMIALGDMPDVSVEGLRDLASTFREHDGARIVAARDPVSGRRGNPVIWPRAHWNALRDLDGDTGARGLLREEDVLTIDVSGAALDLDTPQAFAAREAGSPEA